jgi:hypothetical protein
MILIYFSLFAAARTKLRKMKADEAAKKAAAASDASKPVEKSPHAKEVSFLLVPPADTTPAPLYLPYNLNISKLFLQSAVLRY